MIIHQTLMRNADFILRKGCCTKLLLYDAVRVHFAVFSLRYSYSIDKIRRRNEDGGGPD